MKLKLKSKQRNKLTKICAYLDISHHHCNLLLLFSQLMVKLDEYKINELEKLIFKQMLCKLKQWQIRLFVQLYT